MADIFRFSERLMTMDDSVWARHANGWSVYTRFTCLPLIVLAIWSRVWLGWWALIPLALACLWTWVNPRIFAPVARWDSWAAEGTLGERVFLDRANRDIPAHHRRMAVVLTWAMVVAVLPLIWGLWALELVSVVGGVTGLVLLKVWFVDRMVWMYQEMGRPEV